MRSLSGIIILTAFLFLLACGGNQKPPSAIDSFKAYALAYKQKDTTSMKLLLSDASLKMAEQQAQQQNVTVDDIVKNETLFTENQKDFFFRNEKIEGDRATIEVKNSFGSWDVVPFVREEGVWKIDKQGIARQMQQQNDSKMKELDNLINNSNPQDGSFNPSNPTINPNNPTINPSDQTVNPANSQDLTISPNMPEKNDTVNPRVSPSIITNQTVQP